MKRKSPIRHTVKTKHKRYRIHSYMRGHDKRNPLHQRTLIQYGFPKISTTLKLPPSPVVESPKYLILYTPNKIAGQYEGMNFFAAQELGIHFPHPKNTILIWNGLSLKDKKITIQHEKDEIAFMQQGLPYAEAHTKATHLEKLPIKNNPFKKSKLEPFLFNKHRRKIWEDTKPDLREILKEGFPKEKISKVFVFGSFVSKKEFPKDLDVAIIRTDLQNFTDSIDFGEESILNLFVVSDDTFGREELQDWLSEARKKYKAFNAYSFVDITKEVL